MLPFQPGVFRGTGEWIDRKAQGGYTVEYAIRQEADHIVHSVVRVFPVPEGSTVYGQQTGAYEERSTVTFAPGEKNEFRVTIDSAKGSVHGSGYVYGDQCHYDLDVAPEVHLEFTFFSQEGQIGGLGSSTNKGNFTSWRETLQLL